MIQAFARHLVTGAYLATVVLAATAIREAVTPAQMEQLLPGVAVRSFRLIDNTPAGELRLANVTAQPLGDARDGARGAGDRAQHGRRR